MKGLPVQKESNMKAKQLFSAGKAAERLSTWEPDGVLRRTVWWNPLQLALAVQPDHRFKSRFLIDTLHIHGFCSSYAEVQKFKRCASVHDKSSLLGFASTHAVQHVADNADYDVCTMDGRNTFRGMHLLVTVTPPLSNSRPFIPRAKISLNEESQKRKIPIHPYRISEAVLSKVQYEKIPDRTFNDRYASFDELWLATGFLNFPRSSSFHVVSFL